MKEDSNSFFRTKAMQECEKETLRFSSGSDWQDYYYRVLLDQLVLYRGLMWGALGLLVFCMLGFVFLLPLKRVQLAILHESPHGLSWVSIDSLDKQPDVGWNRTASEISHYIRLHESYDPISYGHQIRVLPFFSTPEVFHQFRQRVESLGKKALPSYLGNKAYRSVEVKSIFKINSGVNRNNSQHNGSNMAQVTYEVTDHAFDSNRATHHGYSALIAWKYVNPSSDPNVLLYNWDGFVVTHFSREPIHLTNKEQF